MTSQPPLSTPPSSENRQWRLKSPIESYELVGPQHFELVNSSIPTADTGEILVRTLCLGTSPAQRSYVTCSNSMHDKVAAGEVMRGRGVGVVLESHAANYQPGDIVIGSTGWQDYCVFDTTDKNAFSVRKLHSPVRPYTLALTTLGSAALTAYFGLTDIGEIEPGDTVLVSAAAGGVGSCAVQLAKILGCRVIAIAGSSAKCKWLTEILGVDVAIDYKQTDLTDDGLSKAIQQACPNGVDVYFDNVGGSQLEAALDNLALGARIVICGFISTDYQQDAAGPANYTNLLRRRARMQGMFVFDYAEQFEQAEMLLKQWYEQGKLVDTSDTIYGLENMPLALQSLFTGDNMGVRVCQVSNDPK